MKYLRYTVIAVLIYLLVISVRAYFSPVVALVSGDIPDLSSQSNLIALLRAELLPWIALVGFMLAGWLRPSKKPVVYVVLAISVPLLGYLFFQRFDRLGFTTGQSFRALFQGYGGEMLGWIAFYVFALVALPFAKRDNPEDRDGGETV